MANASLYMDVIARDQASSVFNKVGHSAKAMGTNVDKASKAHRAFSGARRILTGLATGYAGIKVAQFAKDSIRAQSQLNEALNATSVVFKKQSGDIKAWSENSAQSFGQSQTQALSTARRFGTLFQSAGVNGRQLANYSKQVTTLASDIASFNDVSVQQAIDDLSSGLTGQTEPMRKYGVFLSDARLKQKAMAMGIYEGTGSLTDQQRTLAAYNLVLEQTGVTSNKYAKQAGDFQRTQESYANQTRKLAGEWENVKAAAGKALLPLATTVVKSLNTALPAIRQSLNKGDLGNTLKDMAPKVEGFFKSFSQNLPELKSIGSDFTDAIGTIADAVGGVFDVFTSLPKGVQQGIITITTAALAMKALNRAAGGGGMTGFAAAVESIPHAVARSALSTAAAESVKAVFGNRFGRMTITAGVVNVNGRIAGGPGGAGKGGKGGGGGMGGAKWLLGSAALTSIVGATVAAVAAGSWFMATGRWNRLVDQQRGNTTTAAGSYGSDRGPRPTGEVWNDKGTGMSMTARERLGATYRANASREAARASDAAAAAAERHRKAVVESYKAQDRAQASDRNRRNGLNDVSKSTDTASKKFKNLGAAVAGVKDKKVKVTEDGADKAKGKVKGLGAAVGALKNKRVKVDEDGSERSKGRVRGLKLQIDGLKPKTVKVNTETQQSRTALWRLMGQLDAIPRTIPVNVQVKRVGGGISVGGRTFARGGRIVGPGTSTSDSIPALLSDGEYVIRASSVDKYGLAFLDAVNRGTLAMMKKGGWPKPPKKPGKNASDEAKRKYQNALSRYQNSPFYEAQQAGKAAAMNRKLADEMARQNITDENQRNFLLSMSPAAALKILKNRKQRRRLPGMASNYAALNPPEEPEAQDTSATDPEEERQREVRDAINAASEAYRNFASIATTSVMSVDEAQGKLADSNQAVIDAQKAVDIAGSDRERALASARLTQALEAQAQAQKNVTNAGRPTAANITSNMSGRLNKLRDFAAAVRTLKQNGLNAVTLSEILQMGPEQGYDFAKALLDGGFGALNEVNNLQGQLNTTAADLGMFTYATGNESTVATQAAAQAAGQAGGALARSIEIKPAPVTVSIDGNAIAKALVTYKRQNGGSIPGLAV